MPMTGKPVMETAFRNLALMVRRPAQQVRNLGLPSFVETRDGPESIRSPLRGETNKPDKVRVNANVVLNCQKPNDATMSLTAPHSPPATLFRPFARAFTIYDRTRLAWARPVMSRSWSHEQMCTWRMVHLTIFGWISSQ